MHTLEDMTSPMHTTDDGIPRVWEGLGFLGHKGAAHWMGENEPSDSWVRFGQAIRLTLAAYVQANPVGAAQHGINAAILKAKLIGESPVSFDSQFMIKGDPIGEDAARQCALGNPAACNH